MDLKPSVVRMDVMGIADADLGLTRKTGQRSAISFSMLNLT